jgi:hypothetical protein
MRQFHLLHLFSVCLCVSCPVLLDLKNDQVSRLCSSIALFGVMWIRRQLQSQTSPD